MFAIVDEASREGSDGVFYVVSSVVIVADKEPARTMAREVVGERIRPFHWHKEGVTARQRMVDVLEHLEPQCRVYVHHPTGCKGQERARAALLAEEVELLAYEQVEELIIEGRDDAGNGRDRAVVLDVLTALEADASMTYHWTDKADPLTWFADTMASAAADWLADQDRGGYWEQLQQLSGVQDPIYRTGA